MITQRFLKNCKYEPNKVSEHTNNQIKESIRASATCGELEIVIDRELTTFTESIEIIRKRRDDLVEDYERLSPKRSDLSRSVALKRENLSKNRYTDVLPYDDTRNAFDWLIRVVKGFCWLAV